MKGHDTLYPSWTKLTTMRMTPSFSEEGALMMKSKEKASYDFLNSIVVATPITNIND